MSGAGALHGYKNSEEFLNYDYKRGFVVYPHLPAGSPGAKAPYVDFGTGKIDPKRYYSQEEAELEWDRMWTKTWNFAGLLTDIPERGPSKPSTWSSRSAGEGSKPSSMTGCYSEQSILQRAKSGNSWRNPDQTSQFS
jgi:hypothetical protein